MRTARENMRDSQAKIMKRERCESTGLREPRVTPRAKYKNPYTELEPKRQSVSHSTSSMCVLCSYESPPSKRVPNFILPSPYWTYSPCPNSPHAFRTSSAQSLAIRRTRRDVWSGSWYIRQQSYPSIEKPFPRVIACGTSNPKPSMTIF
jgi:hypothetical protein